jgi:D-alanyl-D-alanine carboxypeptidase
MAASRHTRRSIVASAGLATAGLALGIPHISAQTPSPAATPVDLDSVLRPIFEASGAPGALASVAHGGNRTDLAFGMASVDPSREASTGDAFRIGSISKTMLTTATLQQVADGRIALDVPVSTYIDGLQHGDEVTPRHLLTMTSGLTDFLKVDGFLPTVLSDPSRVWTMEELIAIGDDLPLDFPPGTSVAYSNTGYIVLARIVEIVTGRAIADVYASDIFDPLGMTDTYLQVSPGLPEPVMHGYVEADLLAPILATPVPAGSFVDMTGLDPSVLSAPGGVVSTLDDLHIWMDELMSGSLIGKELHAERMRFRPWGDDMYGMGITRRPSGAIGHDGSVPGYATALFRDDAGRTVVTVANCEPSILDTDVANALAEAALAAFE